MDPTIKEYVERIRGGCWNCEAVTRALQFEAQMNAFHAWLDEKEMSEEKEGMIKNE